MSAPTSLLHSNNTNGNKRNLTRDLDLIDCKFDELAKKILEELKQDSREFYKNIDEIISEPVAKTILRHRRSKAVSSFGARNGSMRRSVRDAQSQASIEHEPRSLPVEISDKALVGQLQVGKQQPASSQLRQRPAVATSTTSSAYAASNPKRIPSSEDRRESPISKQASYSISKSSTVGDASNLILRQLRKSSTTNQVVADGKQSSSLFKRREKNQADSIQASNKKRPSISPRDFGDDDSDEDFDDFEDDDEEDDDERSISSACPKRQYNLVSKPNVASTVSTVRKYGELRGNPANGQHSDNQPARQTLNGLQTKESALKPRQRSNPIVRSNTISSSSQQQQQQQQQPRSMLLTSKNMGSLYKPHMNYSTSVLGHHRLSDDDEIIIIPTQSPSLISTSPDNDPNADELIERFSISRTKSFWERLSKGSPGKRSAKLMAAAAEPDNNNNGSGNDCSNAQLVTNQNKPRGITTQAASIKEPARTVNKINGLINGNQQQQQQQQQQQFDRMDSTGGSYSNHSCSSSGDENVSSHSHQNPTIAKLQEISRQNRFRQTR